MINKDESNDRQQQQKQRISERNSESFKTNSNREQRLNLQVKSSDNNDMKANATINTSLTNSWRGNTDKGDILQRDCSVDGNRHQPSNASNLGDPAAIELRPSDSRLNISVPTTSGSNENDLICINDKTEHGFKQLPVQSSSVKLSDSRGLLIPSSSNSIPSQSSSGYLTRSLLHNKPGDSKRVRFKSLLTLTPSSSLSLDQDTNDEIVDIDDRVLDTTNFIDNTNSDITKNISGVEEQQQQHEISLNQKEKLYFDKDNDLNEDDESYNHSSESESEEDNHHNRQSSSFRHNNSSSSFVKLNGKDKINKRGFLSSKSLPQQSFGRRLLNGLTSSINSFSNDNQPYVAYEQQKNLLTGASKYITETGKARQQQPFKSGRTFRGSYRYSRAGISMAIFKKLTNLIFQKSTCALFGAFLIHVTLGTVYTLSNINSYLTSYMRKHGSPNATYGGSMWISSSYAVGQGFSMVLGGYIEKRFSAQLACIIGCALHSISIMSTSWSVNHGPLAVLVTYGFMPGFGCGLAYMTPMSNGFGWFPNRKGLVAGVILAGFGIGTFIFNMAQTAFVNPDNLSPLDDSSGYFTQQSILDKVPQLFVFIGSIYAAMQFIGCCLLFKPPDINYRLVNNDKSSDERPILVDNEMTLKRAVHTREFIVLFLVYGITTQGVLFVNSMIKEYGQIFIGNDMYLAWVGSMASIANSAGRLVWGLAIDRFTFTQCFTSITIIFASIMFIMPFEFILSSKVLYLVGTLGIFGSFSGWMSTYPVHLSRVFGRTNSGMIYGLIFISQVSLHKENLSIQIRVFNKISKLTYQNKKIISSKLLI